MCWRKLQNNFCLLHITINLGKNGFTHFNKSTLTEEALSLLNRTAQSSVACLLHQQGSEVFRKSDLFEAFLMDGDDEDNVGSDEVDMRFGKLSKSTQVLTKRSEFKREVGNRAQITLINGTALWLGRQKMKDFFQNSNVRWKLW